MGIFAWIIFGLIAGALARWIMPGRDAHGCLVTMLLGMAGSVVGGFVGTLVGFGEVTRFDIRSMAIAVLGAVIILAVYRQLKSR